jgi:hypothetical protein
MVIDSGCTLSMYSRGAPYKHLLSNLREGNNITVRLPDMTSLTTNISGTLSVSTKENSNQKESDVKLLGYDRNRKAYRLAPIESNGKTAIYRSPRDVAFNDLSYSQD